MSIAHKAPTVREVSRPWIGTLVVCSAVSALATTMFLPSMPGMVVSFDVDYATVQLGLSAFLVVTALVQFVTGPLSDLLGRRPIMIGSLVLFVAGTALCLASTTIELFLAGRMVQGASAAGLVLSRTIIRDLYDKEKAASMIGYTIMAMAIAPMIGPWIGGELDEAMGWRGTFWLLLAVGMSALALVLTDLRETNASLGQPIMNQLRAYLVLLGTGSFWVFIAAGSFASAVFFSFLGGAPAVAETLLAMEPSEYGAWFAACAGGYVVGNFLSGRFAMTAGLSTLIAAGSLFTLAGPIAIFVSFFLGWEAPFALFGWIALTGLGNGMVLPSNTAAAVSIRPDAAGAASGLLATLQTSVGAAGSLLATSAVGDGTHAVSFALVLLAFGAGALLFGLASARMVARGD